MSFDPRHPVLIACRRLGAAFDARDAAIADRLGISRSELRLLNLLEDGPRPHTEIAAHLRLSRAAVTAMVDRLVAAGLVDRAASNDDRRVKLVSLTGRVWGVLAGFYRPAGERVLDVLATSEVADADELAAIMIAMAEGLEPLPR